MMDNDIIVNQKRPINSFVVKRKIIGFTISLLRGLLLFGLCFLILQPLLSKISFSFMTEQDLYDPTVINIPRSPTLDNYRVVADLMSYTRALASTVYYSTLIALLQTLSATVVAYGFARFQFPLKRLLFGLVLFTIIIPPQTFLTSLYLNFQFFDVFGIIRLIMGQPLNLLNTTAPYMLMALGCMGLKSGLFVYLLRQFFRNMPKELEEAAYVDGAGTFRTFWNIMLPGAVPMITSCFLFAFVWQWTDSFYSTLFLRNVSLLSISIGALAERFNNYWIEVLGMGGLPPASLVSFIISTGTLMVIGPVLLMYLFAQRGFVESIAKSGIKE